MMRKSQNQSGATLVVALIMLLIMTIVGIASIQSVVLQERMASNSRQQTLARNNAEYALRFAEETVLEALRNSAELSRFNGTNGLFSAIRRPGGQASVPMPATFDVRDSDAWKVNGIVAAGLDDKVKARDPRYVIEYIGRAKTRGEANVSLLGTASKTENEDPFHFRVTAIGWGRDEKVYSIVESVFRTGKGPGVFVY